MPNDIGIDLGTTKIIVYDNENGELYNEPNILAINNDTGEVLGIGNKAHAMLGRTPDFITAENPLRDGIISDYNLTSIMIRHVLKNVCGETIVKPRVAVCIPSKVTDVEQRAVVDAILSGGARKVYLIEEPVAAAIGAGIDISQPVGRLIVDIGGGTTDVSLLSLSGVVAKSSIKVAGNTLDDAITEYIKTKYKILIGTRTAEAVKINIGTLTSFNGDNYYMVKGRHIITGLPSKQLVSWQEIKEVLLSVFDDISNAIHSVFEQSPPELSGDLKQYGILLTGGGSQLGGICEYLENKFHVKCTTAEDPLSCVAKGTAKAFSMNIYLRDCLTESNERLH